MSQSAAAPDLPNALKSKILERVEKFANIGYWHLDLQTNDLFWSEEVYRIHGLDQDVFIPTLNQAIQFYHEHDRERVSHIIAESIEGKKPFDFQLRLVRMDGATRRVWSHGEVEIDEKGKAVSLYGIFQDITDLSSQKGLYEIATRASSTLVWQWDILADEIEWLGHAHEAFGTKANQDLPKKSEDFFKSLVHPDDQPALLDAFRKHFQKKNDFELEIRIRTFHQGFVWFLARAQAEWNSQNKAVRLIGSLTNIEDLKKTQLKLAQSNRDLEQFAAIASHDLKQPLRSISGFMEILQMKYKDKLDEEADKYINFAIKSAQNMNDLINDLLEYSKIDSDKINYETVSTQELVEDILSLLEDQINKKQAIIETITLPNIECDKLKLHRVLYNLIENGLKYNDSTSPSIKIESYPTSHAWIFTIADNGIGIAPEKAEDVFLMFNRLHHKGEYSGTGIGLSICKKIVELHGGEIWVEQNPEGGSIFFFTIPFKSSVHT